MSRYLCVLATQEPTSFGVDTNDRVLFTTNYTSWAAGVVKYEEEIARILFDNSLGVLNTDLFIGPKSVVPTTGPGPFTTIINTGGINPFENHEGGKYRRGSFQIVVRALSYVVARNRAQAIFNVLDGLRNIEVVAA